MLLCNIYNKCLISQQEKNQDKIEENELLLIKEQSRYFWNPWSTKFSAVELFWYFSLL